MSDEELSLRHRRASEASAGAPSAATRAAIRREAEAQAAARRAADGRPPAANDSRWLMRAVAGLAVVAIAAGLWWQLRPQVGSVTPVAQVSQVEPVAQVAAVPEAAESQRRLELPPPRPPPALAGTAPTAGKLPAATAAPAMVAAAPVPPPPAAAPATALADAAQTAPAATVLAAEVARRFPEAWTSATPVDGLWVQLNAQGKVVDAGRRSTGQSLARAAESGAREAIAPAAITAQAVNSPSARAVAGAVADSSVELVNDRGVPLRITIRREAARP
jgi:hypothetical protein